MRLHVGSCVSGALAHADKARDVRTGEVVALKKVRFDVSRDGVPVTSMREMRILQSCRHSNIVQLKTVVTGSKPDRWACTTYLYEITDNLLRA